MANLIESICNKKIRDVSDDEALQIRLLNHLNNYIKLIHNDDDSSTDKCIEYLEEMNIDDLSGLRELFIRQFIEDHNEKEICDCKSNFLESLILTTKALYKK
jgi:hypothetical protein